jgi:hypothetical protein
VQLGTHLGHDLQATAQAKQAVLGFVRGVFKMN